MKVFKTSQTSYSAIKKAFVEGNLDKLRGYISNEFTSKYWSDKNQFVDYLSSLFKNGGVAFDDTDLDFKISGHQLGSRIELYDLKCSRGLLPSQIMVLRFDGKHAKIITVSPS